MQTVKQLLQTTPKPSGSHDPEAIATEDTAVVQSSQNEVHVPAEQIVEQAVQTAPSIRAQPEVKRPSTSSRDEATGRGKRDRARMTAAFLILARTRLERCTATAPAEVPDEELSELLELHLFGESVHWPAGWSVAKAMARLAIARRPG